ncbi:MAG: hypothetical protein F6J94_26360 [Moorea sp. SIO1F2]|uniref:hypothetical protein n=1 Tax=Moorena sp. SIO1F2 TaxID=2607819 RepID=UPI0013BE0439|nr:hypothetical protein [Moorena sp. SIO1F2]NET85302.1 hypothetical protein [Moorena sp. SIO1F2]
MGRWGDGEVGRWGGGEIFIKGNYPDMILAVSALSPKYLDKYQIEVDQRMGGKFYAIAKRRPRSIAKFA